MATFGTFADLTPAQVELAQRRQATGGDPLSALLQGLQQGVQVAQIPAQIQQQAIANQLANQLAQSKLAAIPLEQERQQLLLNQLRAQMDPNYAAQQNAAKIAFDVDRARALGRVERELAVTPQTQLKFTETNDEIITANPFTGAEVGRIKKTPGVVYRQTERGWMAFTDPTNPLKGTIVPGTEPITTAEGSLAPIYDPADPTKILGYTVPKNFKSVNDITGRSGSGGAGKPLSEAERNSLLSLSGQKGFLTDVLKDYDKLNEATLSPTLIGGLGGKVGPIAGRVESVKNWLGIGDREFKSFNTRLRANLFQSARTLQGAGVLTEGDITRMEELSPTASDNRDSFIGGIEGMKDIMLNRATSFRDINYSRMNPDEKRALDDIIAKLSIPVTGGSATPLSPVVSPSESGVDPAASKYLQLWQTRNNP